MVTISSRRSMSDERGFTLIELMVALIVSVGIMGAAMSVMSGVQSTYRHQQDDVTVEQEGRFAVDLIRKIVEPAGSNPYSVNTTACPSAGTAIQHIRLDPNGNGINDDIRVQADISPPDGIFIGPGGAGGCAQPNEDVTIFKGPLTAAASGSQVFSIMKRDRGVPTEPVAGIAMTENIFTGLLFEYFDANHVATAILGSVRFVRVTVTGESRRQNPTTQRWTAFSLQSDVRLRNR